MLSVFAVQQYIGRRIAIFASIKRLPDIEADRFVQILVIEIPAKPAEEFFAFFEDRIWNALLSMKSCRNTSFRTNFVRHSRCFRYGSNEIRNLIRRNFAIRFVSMLVDFDPQVFTIRIELPFELGLFSQIPNQNTAVACWRDTGRLDTELLKTVNRH